MWLFIKLLLQGLFPSCLWLSFLGSQMTSKDQVLSSAWALIGASPLGTLGCWEMDE